MAEGSQSALPFIVLVVATFACAACLIAFTVTLNWLMLALALVPGAAMAWGAQKVLA